jgi:hypothetical protein
MATLRPRFLLLALGGAPALGAQEWQPGSAVPLVRAATEARTGRDLTAAVAGWQAEAHGVVRFVVRVDHEGSPVERVMKVDELRVEVYGEAPSRSKQRIVAWRDTVLQPTTIRYHRDHLGIVANDFGPRIRLGQGEEVRDVIHPLTPEGMAAYQFALGDTLQIVSEGDTLTVVAVQVRPVDPDGVGLVGTLFLDRDRAALVRLRFTFTPASYLDPTVDRITVVLENALHEQRRWLPFRQSIAIDRASPWIVLPVTTRIVAEWQIAEYHLGVVHPPGRFAGAAIDGLGTTGGEGWTGPIPVEGLGGMGAAPALRQLGQELAGRRLEGLPVVRLAGPAGVSSLLRVNRVEGVAVGVGLRWTPTHRTLLAGDLALATGDGRVTGGARVRRTIGAVAWQVSAGRRVVDLADTPGGSSLANSVATVISGRDQRDWFLRDRVGLEARWNWHGVGVALGIAHETVSSLEARFTALDGTQRTNPSLGGASSLTTSSDFWWRTATARWRLRSESGANWRRVWGRLDEQGPGGTVVSVEGGVGSAAVPVHRAFVLGGRGSLVGHRNRAAWGSRLLRVEVGRPVAVAVPIPALPGVPSQGGLESRLVPFVAVGRVAGAIERAPEPPSGSWRVSLGAHLDLWGPLLRLTVGWAPGPGRIGITFDAHPDWWPLL